MAEYDLVIRNGTVATAADTTSCDVGIRNGTIVALGQGLAAGAHDIDASGKLVLPGAIDSHCHIEQKSSNGIMCADDFYSATVAAAWYSVTISRRDWPRCCAANGITVVVPPNAADTVAL